MVIIQETPIKNFACQDRLIRSVVALFCHGPSHTPVILVTQMLESTLRTVTLGLVPVSRSIVSVYVNGPRRFLQVQKVGESLTAIVLVLISVVYDGPHPPS